jgi:hypothetical protein
MVILRMYARRERRGPVTRRSRNDGVLTLDTDVNVVLLVSNLCLTTSVIGLREGVEGLEILDVCGHMID